MKTPTRKIATWMIPSGHFSPENFPPKKIPTQNKPHPENCHPDNSHTGDSQLKKLSSSQLPPQIIVTQLIW